MKYLTLKTYMLAALAFGTGIAFAGQTNAVQHISLQLTFATQGPIETNKPAPHDLTATVINSSIATKDVIHWLGTATTNVFPKNASLVRVRHFNSGGDTVTYEVRFGTNLVDVSSFFAETYVSEQIDNSTYNTKNGLLTGSKFENLHLLFTNTPPFNLVPYFQVFGSASETYKGVKSGKTTWSVEDTSASNLAGDGIGTNGIPALITGSLQINATTTEVK